MTHDGNVFQIGPFRPDMEKETILPLVREIKNQRRLGEEGRIDLYINSPGGYTYLLFDLIDKVEMAKSLGITVRTIVTDMAYSCGSALAIAGTKGERYIAPSARHLVHYGSGGVFATSPEELDRGYDEMKAHFLRIEAHYEKYARIPDLRAKIQTDTYFIPAPQAISFGMADKLTTEFDIGYL
jgi:ATP-dependent Clp protease, protease subunit